MNNICSNDYHDYVFKEGKFVGKFEEMYKNSIEIPWHQDQTAYALFSDVDIVILKKYHFSNILDLGCGMGFFTNRCRKELHDDSGNKPKVTGVDVSSTAINKAKNMFPEVKFIDGDICDLFIDEKFDLIICKEILWYLITKLDSILKKIKSLMKKGKYLYIPQSFPECLEFVGKDVISNPKQLLQVFKSHFNIIYYCIEYDPTLSNRPLIHLLLKRD